MQFKQLNKPPQNLWSLFTISLLRFIKLTALLILFTYSQVNAIGLSILPNEVRGKVTTQKGEPIQNVSVLIRGTKKATTTNNEGLFSLSVTNGKKTELVISSAGYISKTVILDRQTELNIILENDNANLNDQIAIGLTTDIYGKNGILRKRLTEAVKFDQPPYSTRYPSLLTYLDPIVEEKEWQGMRSRGNQFSGNVIIGGPEQKVKLMGGEFATATEKNNFSTKEDPGFVDMKNGNFMLKSNSIVFEKIPGFKPVPFDKMGLYKDTYRK